MFSRPSGLRFGKESASRESLNNFPLRTRSLTFVRTESSWKSTFSFAVEIVLQPGNWRESGEITLERAQTVFSKMFMLSC